MRQLTSMIFEGVPERFPDLPLAFLGAGAGWAPYSMERMDDEYAKRGEVEAPVLRRKPSGYAAAARSGSPARRTSGCYPRPSSSWASIRSSGPRTSRTGTYPGSIDELRDRAD
jgi:hypothetical protein